MAIIGNFKLGVDSIYSGQITTLTLFRKARLVPVEATTEKAPDFRVYAGASEIGIAWARTSKGGEPYVSVRLDDPSFPTPIWANLVASQKEHGAFNLLWDRPRPQASQAE